MHNHFLSGIFNQNILIFYMINGGIHNAILDFSMPLITNFGSVMAWAVICGLLFKFGGKKGKKVALVGLIVLFVSNTIVYLLKFIIAEPRPFVTLPNVDLLVSEKEYYSFPSGHTASSFAAAAVIGLKYKFNLKGKSYSLIYPLLAFAGVIGFSRIYVGVHYPLDVVFGAIIGILTAFSILKIENNFFNGKMSQISLLDELNNGKI